MIPPFRTAKVPRLVFGDGVLGELPDLVRRAGRTCLLVTGARSLEDSGRLAPLVEALSRAGVDLSRLSVSGEPSPDLVDLAVSEGRRAASPPEVVVGMGGGSVLDAVKAISAMLPIGAGVEQFLEGEGRGRPHPGGKLPFIAVPTTAGTGSEATKNAVLGRPGRDGFKASLRHDDFVPDVALVDPELLSTCAPAVRSACAMDALTQLLESYLSTGASPLTDALALQGLRCSGRSLIAACTTSPPPAPARADLAYAAFLSGVTLANAGLGIVHGLAPPLGSWFGIPHGVACGTLLASAVRVNLERLRELGAEGEPALARQVTAARALFDDAPADDGDCLELLPARLEEWTGTLGLEPLGNFGVGQNDLDAIATAAGLKNNPVALSRDDVVRILRQRMG